MSPNSFVKAVLLIAANPKGEHHFEKKGVGILAPGLSDAPWRGSVAMVTGMPKRVRSANFWILLFQFNNASA